MLTEKKILDKGFTEYKPTPFDSEAVDKRYQKCYYRNNCKSYFLDIVHYSMTHPHTGEDLSGYEIETQLYAKGTHNAINVRFLEDDIDYAEKFVNELFESGALEDYERD